MDIFNAAHEQVLFDILKNYTLAKVLDVKKSRELEQLIDQQFSEALNARLLTVIMKKIESKGINYNTFFQNILCKYNFQDSESKNRFEKDLKAQYVSLGIEISQEEQTRIVSEICREQATALFGNYIRNFPEERDTLLEAISNFPEFETMVRGNIFNFELAK